jgi:hypothetical protein
MKTIIKCPNCTKVQAVKPGMVNCSTCNFRFNTESRQPLRALSIQQPWAWAILNGLKDIENRKWTTTFTGQILIHAGQKFDNEGLKFIKDMNPDIEIPTEKEFKKMMGGIVGKAVITGCVEESDSPWFFGPFGFTLANAKAIDLIPCKGQLKFFTPKID